VIRSKQVEVPLKIVIVVQGRFQAFDLARELIRAGVQVILLTNYPKYIAERFGIPKENVISCLSHGVVSKLIDKAGGWRLNAVFEPCLHSWFSRWAVRTLRGMDVNAIHVFSGVCEELMLGLSGRPVLKLLARASAHIRTQARLLEEETARCGQAIDHPSPWRLSREEREYKMSDLIIVNSSFARESFEAEGVPPEKIRTLLLGAQLEHFRASEDDIERRCARILAGEPLRVLTVGSFNLRKGALDLVEIAKRVNGRMKFRMVGDAASDMLRLKKAGPIEFIGRQPQFSLPSIYREADLFLFPTIEDGYAVVLSQAQAAGLPVLATPNCSAPDIVKENKNGWVLPIRNPGAFVEKLEWCDSNREALARMVRSTYDAHNQRDWAQVASDLIKICEEWQSQHAV